MKFINKTMSRAWIGIDPGKSSFITTISSKGEVIFDQVPMIGKEIDVKALSGIFKEISFGYDEINCTIEDVHAIFGAGASSTFEFGRITGLLEALLVANDIPFVKTQPKSWQKEMWEGIPNQKKASSTGRTQVNDTKLMSLMAAQRLFPNIDLRATERCKKPDHNKVDSLLIAEFCKRKFK